MSNSATIRDFISKGVITFRQASAGRYWQESDSMKALRREMLIPSRSDRDNLRRDRLMVGRDMRVSMDKLVQANG